MAVTWEQRRQYLRGVAAAWDHDGEDDNTTVPTPSPVDETEPPK